MFRSKRGLDFGLGRGYSGSQARTFHRAKLEIEYYHPSFRQPDISQGSTKLTTLGVQESKKHRLYSTLILEEKIKLLHLNSNIYHVTVISYYWSTSFFLIYIAYSKTLYSTYVSRHLFCIKYLKFVTKFSIVINYCSPYIFHSKLYYSYHTLILIWLLMSSLTEQKESTDISIFIEESD